MNNFSKVYSTRHSDETYLEKYTFAFQILILCKTLQEMRLANTVRKIFSVALFCLLMVFENESATLQPINLIAMITEKPNIHNRTATQ